MPIINMGILSDSGRNRYPMEDFMNSLMEMEDREIRPARFRESVDKLSQIRERIKDESYLNHAIFKIATDLSHYLTK